MILVHVEVVKNTKIVVEEKHNNLEFNLDKLNI
ncbi:hypothetical protein BD780_004075 [Clostridium tetanomorphum]|nr:hypothetical protein [Clostridium tetanomorphum]NRS86850.1 hypothetical protein [Clostridium tetanomorphum]NRZ99392.1 hypothetical protein [Clostridium tetanomorphum]SQC00350.1 Uncharacterised protein [Clostridium tetanomorphum]